MYIPDNYDKFEEHEAEQARYISRLPVCDKCGEHIQSDYAYKIDGEGLLCEDCFLEWADDCKVDPEDLIEEEEW